MTTQAIINALFLCTVFVTCLDARQPLPDPSIWFVTPTPGATWQGDSLAIEIGHTGIDWGPDAMHYHLYVDGGTFQNLPDDPIYDTFEAVLWYRNSMVFPGEHAITLDVHDRHDDPSGLSDSVSGWR